MRVVVVSEVRLFRDARGAVVCDNGTRAYPFWCRYLDAFNEVTVVARVSGRTLEGGAPVEGDRVTVHPVPDYSGVGGLATQFAGVRRSLTSLTPSNAFVLRVPGVLGTLAARWLMSQSLPFAVEVVGDPHDMFSKGAVHHPLRPLVRAWMTHSLRSQCRNAVAASYVTASTLQRRYPPDASAYVTHYSSVELPPEAFAVAPRRESTLRSSPPYTIIGVGRLNQQYKGADVLLNAVAICLSRGIVVRLVWLGDGAALSQLERQARDLGISDRCEFLGNVPSGHLVRQHLDAADLFVLPSRQEGLPRAMIEAMARGLPCIGTSVGGIPELLRPDELAPPNDPNQLADRIMQTLVDPRRRGDMSARNLAKAREYAVEILQSRRTMFYQEVRDRVTMAHELGGTTTH